MDPAGRLALAKDVGDGREVDQVDAAGVPVHLPNVGVAEDVCLDLFSGANDCEQRFGVFQAADTGPGTRVVMNENHCGLVAVGVQ